MTQTEIQIDTKTELLKCQMSAHYFIKEYVYIFDNASKEWIKFTLWEEQESVLNEFLSDQSIIALKARQLGLTWLALSFTLWSMLFRPVAACGLFSRRDTEAMHLLSDERLKGMYKRLPDWMRFQGQFQADSGHNWILPNNSSAKAFPANAGDSYTLTLAVVDEADLVPDLGKLLASVKPTIDNGGKLILISRVDKSKPESEFKNIYRAAKQGLNNWKAIFLPWSVHPGRTPEWYETQKSHYMAQEQTLDTLHEQYPATDTEALAPRTMDKRIPSAWLEACYREIAPLAVVGEQDSAGSYPAIPGLVIYKPPEPGRHYKIGIDPAEGNPTSDDSALSVVDDETGEEVTKLKGKFQPSTIAAHANTVGKYYNDASVLPERNNHGHAVILWLRDSSNLEVLEGEDGKPGWLSNSLGKTRLYDQMADICKDIHDEASSERAPILHSFDTYTQLASIEGSTLRAPAGQMDDLADSFALAQAARLLKPKWKTFKFLSA